MTKEDKTACCSPSDETVAERFLRYVVIDTQSDACLGSFPSTAGQLTLLTLLADEMRLLGLSDVELDDYGYVTGTIPSTTTKNVPAIGFIAHVDTSPEVSGKNVNPRIVKYEGGDLVVSQDNTIEAGALCRYKGHRLVTSDGTTLLGADDKAGVAEIMTAAAHLISHPEIEHGTICMAFTPDEEIGKGADHFDVARFGAEYAYTVDGGAQGSLEYETFNAAEAFVGIKGFNTHPGYAKGRMINAQSVAFEFDGLLPRRERPEYTSGYEGFYHLISIEGTVEECSMHYIIRDHDRALFEQRKQELSNAANLINDRCGRETVRLSIVDQYYNMREKIEPHRVVIDTAERAMVMAGVKPVVEPVRGGTDGSRLSYMGLPCPNIFSGSENMHSRTEFVSIEVMEKAVEVIVNIAVIFSDNILNN